MAIDCDNAQALMGGHTSETLDPEARHALFVHVRGCEACRVRLERELRDTMRTRPQVSAPAGHEVFIGVSMQGENAHVELVVRERGTILH